jgi:23S rRNA pseudouridine2604 synthase
MAFSKTYDGDLPQRINKWLAQAGVCSRREAEGLIAQGLVSIDGEIVTDAGRKIATGQTLVLADGASLQLDQQISVLVHKPMGYVSAQPEAGQIPAARLLTKANLAVRGGAIPAHDLSLAPLGRLDQDSRGLLLLSQDGALAKAVIGPQSALDKEYSVRVAGRLTDGKLALLRHGLRLDERELKPAIVEVLPDERLRFVLMEGRNRQIRRMCEAVDLVVTDLLRTRIGPISLAPLEEGHWRPLLAEERAALLAASSPP